MEYLKNITVFKVIMFCMLIIIFASLLQFISNIINRNKDVPISLNQDNKYD